jgi:signal transduction histidine kinase
MVGHDIRNPLQAITNELYLLNSNLALIQDGKNKEDMKESIVSIKENVEYIQKIVQDLQDYAKPPKPVIKKTRLDRLCREVVVENGLREDIEVTCKVEPKARTINTDSVFLRRVLKNLSNNAVQAMAKGGKLELKAFRDGECVVITVRDTGSGVPEEAKSKLFTPLFTTKSKGQGFGLASAKRLVEALNGSISFESEAGKGTNFTIRLPA